MPTTEIPVLLAPADAAALLRFLSDLGNGGPGYVSAAACTTARDLAESVIAGVPLDRRPEVGR